MVKINSETTTHHEAQPHQHHHHAAVHPQQHDMDTMSRHHEQNEHYEDCLHEKIGYSVGEVILSVVWLGLLGLYIFYLYELITVFIFDMTYPTTSVRFVKKVPLDFPAVTICNWNSEYDCNTCNLTLLACNTVNSTGDITGCEEHFVPTYRTIEQHGSLFHCYEFNNDPEHVYEVSTTGYAGSVSIYFKIPKTDRMRSGLQVTFHEVGSEPMVFAETNFAEPSVDNFFSLRHFSTTRFRTTKQFPSLHTSSWEHVYSSVDLAEEDPTMVVVSVAYSDLNVNEVKEEARDGVNMFAAIFHVFLILLGIDFIKIVRGLLLIPEAIKERQFKLIFEEFI